MNRRNLLGIATAAPFVSVDTTKMEEGESFRTTREMRLDGKRVRAELKASGKPHYIFELYPLKDPKDSGVTITVITVYRNNEMVSSHNYGAKVKSSLVKELIRSQILAWTLLDGSYYGHSSDDIQWSFLDTKTMEFLPIPKS